MPSTRERHLAAAMHLATIPAPILAPVLGLAISPKGTFLHRQALRSLKETLVLNLFLGLLMLGSLSYSAWRLWTLYLNDWQGFSLTELLIRLIVGWLVLTAISAFNLLGAIKSAAKAYNSDS